ncbi:pseudouridine synthase [Dysgonomonas sp. 25]|uniref:pseudouridine synthase n=1 Tax=Dysgonomonas sp. 25 TaxID=2302933 RepID=UPI0013D70EC6|nr:pseudouridine synthase [Dysgonomonas sp. 25]NDV68916.1 rRNA pseudouridine synthase [Dysgonomonas sp. 25]
MTDGGNYGENREGSASPERNFNGEGSQDNAKKKRPRVGELRKQPINGGGNDRNPYRSQSNEGYNSNRSYNNNGGGYNNNGGGGYRNNNGGGYNNNGGGGYRNNNGGGYNNNGGGGYRNNNGGGYNNNGGGGYRNNNGGGYNNNGGGNYRNNNGGGYNNNGGGNYRNNNGGGYNNNGGGGYRNNNGGGYNNNGGGYRNNNGGGYNNQRGGRPQGQKFVKKFVAPVKYKENIDPETPIRLNKYLANAGVCSRREADSYITAGVVKVNGEVVNELGVKVKRGDLVTFHDQPVRLESKVYVLLNKPKNCVTTSDDPENRLTVMDLVKGACPERIYPVGRLDRNTTGVLLLTNDGDLASKLTHPKFKKKKIYQVTLDKNVAIEDMQAIADGVELDDGEIHADSIAYQSEDVLNVVGIEIHSGRNRVVRRIFEKLGYQVIRLDRVYFAGLTKKNLGRGKWRYLTEREVNMLRMGAFE